MRLRRSQPGCSRIRIRSDEQRRFVSLTRGHEFSLRRLVGPDNPHLLPVVAELLSATKADHMHVIERIVRSLAGSCITPGRTNMTMPTTEYHVEYRPDEHLSLSGHTATIHPKKMRHKGMCASSHRHRGGNPEIYEGGSSGRARLRTEATFSHIATGPSTLLIKRSA